MIITHKILSYFLYCFQNYERAKIVIYEPSAGRRCSRMSAFFKARATKERVPLMNARMNGRCLHASGSYNIFCTKIKLNLFVLIH
jgi:ferric-dicitrate binding protein FerR (iron transport regulator)